MALWIVAACGGEQSALRDADDGNTGATVRIWPEMVADSDDVGVYVEVTKGTSGTLELQTFEGTICAIGITPDAGVPMMDAGLSDAGIPDSSSGCRDRARYSIERSPQTFVGVFQWTDGTSSGLITATVFDKDGKAVTSVFRRVMKGQLPDAGVDAGTSKDAGITDAVMMGDAQ